MSEEDFREGLPPTKEQIEAHYEPGKPYGYWRRKGDPRAFRLGWHNDEVVYDCTPWRSSERLMSAPTSLYCSAWQPVDSSNSLLPWSVVEVSEYRTPTDDEIRAHEANGGAWSDGKGHFRLLGFRDDVLCCWIVHNLEVHPLDYFGLDLRGVLYGGAWPISERPEFRDKIRPVDRQGKPIPWSSLRTMTVPRRFADVRPDRHGWRWWRIMGGPDAGIIGARFEAMNVGLWGHTSIWSPRTVIPTDEQGNPVSWEAAGFAAEAMRSTQEIVQRAANDATPSRSVGDIEWTVTGQPVTRDTTVEPAVGTVRSTHTARIRQLDRFVAEAIQAGNQAGFSIESSIPPRPDQFSNNPATPPLTPEGLLAAMQNHTVPGIHVTVGTGAKLAQTEAITTWPLPLPRFTADELDDVDHSKTTKLDESTLRRGKLPTVEQIAKYREVRAKRTNGTVTEALKASGIDCEVAQYVLERWAGGLSDIQACGLVVAIVDRAAAHVTRAAIDARARVWLTDRRPALDITEPTDDSAQRRREEREAQRQRMAALQAQLAVERAARTAEPQPEPTRFDLLECDPAADPAASIAAWEARQKRSAVHSMPQSLPQPGHRRPFEVVDAEAEGLRTGAAFTALLGRALNPNC